MVDKTDGKENGHSRDLNVVHDTMLDGLAQLADYFGFSKVMGQIYGAMLLSDRPLCLDDFVERLSISKANASMNVRTLENLGMARQVWVRGSSGKRKFYEAESDFWQIITNILKGREMRDLERALVVMDDNIHRLKESMPHMSDEDRQLADLYLDRIAKMQALFQFAQMIIVTILAREGNAGLPDILRMHGG